jgi:hypothetical protein
MLKDQLENFIAPVYSKTPRNTDSYRAFTEYATLQLSGLTNLYQTTANNQHTLRLIREDIDSILRRYHQYCIEQRDGMKAHYHEVGADNECDFEHLIPAARIRDLLLAGAITVKQALNAPTVRLSRTKHHTLKESGWSSKTPDMWLPFKRYSNVFTGVYQTYDGTPVDPLTWTLNAHFEYFKHLI